jgi:hypothetical protein
VTPTTPTTSVLQDLLDTVEFVLSRRCNTAKRGVDCGHYGCHNENDLAQRLLRICERLT